MRELEARPLASSPTCAQLLFLRRKELFIGRLSRGPRTERSWAQSWGHPGGPWLRSSGLGCSGLRLSWEPLGLAVGGEELARWSEAGR